MKKSISLILVLAMLITGVLAGCSKTDSNDDNSKNDVASGEDKEQNDKDKGNADDEEVSITFGFWGDTKEAEMKMQLAEAYMKEHPNVNIEFEYTDGAGYLTKMQTWFSSNTTPDVFGVASDVLFQFLGSDLFEDLAPYIEKDNLSSEWNMDTIDSVYTKDGKVHAVPFISKVFAMAYNKDLFDAAGLDYPTDDWTVEDMLEAARAITTGEGTDKVYGLRWGVRAPEFYRNLYGNPIYDVDTSTMNVADNAEFKSAVSLFADTIKEGLAPNEASGAISTGGFETGKFGMQLSATWDIATFQTMIGDTFEWDIVMLPINEEFNQRMLTTYRGNGWSIAADSKEKEVSWDFVKFMSLNEESQKAAQSFGIPELLTYANSDEFLTDFGGLTPYSKQVFINMAANSTSFYNLGAYAEVNDMMKAQYELLLADQITIDKMIEDIQKQGEGILSVN